MGDIDPRNALPAAIATRGEEPAVTVGECGMKKVGRRGLAIVERMASNGRSDTSIAKCLKMDRETFRHCRRRQPAVESALQRGRGILEDFLVNVLLTKARDPKDPGGLVASIFLLKARCGFKEGELPPGTQVIANNVVIQEAPRLTDAQFQRLLDRGGGQG